MRWSYWSLAPSHRHHDVWCFLLEFVIMLCSDIATARVCIFVPCTEWPEFDHDTSQTAYERFVLFCLILIDICQFLNKFIQWLYTHFQYVAFHRLWGEEKLNRTTYHEETWSVSYKQRIAKPSSNFGYGECIASYKNSGCDNLSISIQYKGIGLPF